MEQHFQAKLRLWYSEEKISIFYYYFSITFELYFQGIIPLRHLLMKIHIIPNIGYNSQHIPNSNNVKSCKM